MDVTNDNTLNFIPQLQVAICSGMNEFHTLFQLALDFPSLLGHKTHVLGNAI